MNNNCPVCASQLNDIKVNPDGWDGSFYSCPRCGDFYLADSLVATIGNVLEKDQDAWAKVSYALRSMQKKDERVVLNTYTAQEIIQNKLPSPKEQADLLIRWLAENTGGPGETVWVEPKTHAGIIGAKSPQGFALVIQYLFDVRLLSGNLSEAIGEPGRAHATLSFDGWNYYESLRQGETTYRKAFMAMKFNDPVLESVLNEVFRPSVKKAGFSLKTLSDDPRAGLIDDRLRVEIQSSDFVIADLTHDNNGAYWEAGYAEGLGKPVIYTCGKKKFESDNTHFDTNHHLTIVWDEANPQEAGERLKATIRATLPRIAVQSDD